MFGKRDGLQDSFPLHKRDIKNKAWELPRQGALETCGRGGEEQRGETKLPGGGSEKQSDQEGMSRAMLCDVHALETMRSH